MFIEISSIYPGFFPDSVEFNIIMRDNLDDRFYELIGYFVFICQLRSRYPTVVLFNLYSLLFLLPQLHSHTKEPGHEDTACPSQLTSYG